MNRVQHKRSNVPGKVPVVSDIRDGEILINIADNKLYGKQVVGGIETIVEYGSGNDKYYRHNQNLPSTVWTIEHNLNKYPSVTVIDSAGSQHEGEIDYIDQNNLTITFSAAFSGFADLN